MKTDKKYILVTGGAGYIGSHTVVALIEKGFTPIIVDDFRNSNKDVIPRLEKVTNEEIIYFNAACQDSFRLKGVFSQFPIDGIIHFAADKAVGESMENPCKYFENNFGSLTSMLQLAEEFKIKRFVFSSSCTVYGEPKEIPVNELSPVSYSSPYGFTKKVCEEMIQQFVANCPLVHATLLRYFNPIGAHESGIIGEEPDGKPNNLLPFITQTAAGIRKELTIFGDDYDTPDGTCIRDYIHVVDLAEAHVAALEHSDKIDTNPMVYNVGTGTGTSVLEMIKIFEKETGLTLPCTIGPRRDGDIKEIYANTDKVNKDLNWESRKTIKESISTAWAFEQYIREKRKNE